MASVLMLAIWTLSFFLVFALLGFGGYWAFQLRRSWVISRNQSTGLAKVQRMVVKVREDGRFHYKGTVGKQRAVLKDRLLDQSASRWKPGRVIYVDEEAEEAVLWTRDFADHLTAAECGDFLDGKWNERLMRNPEDWKNQLITMLGLPLIVLVAVMQVIVLFGVF